MLKFIYWQLRNKLQRTKVKSTDVSFGAQIGLGTKIQKFTIIDRRTEIGAYTYIGRRCTIAAAQIGRYCSIGDGVSIGLGAHNLSAISTSTQFHKEGFEGLIAEPCTIGHDVWVGAHSLILRGVTVGNGAVIGANSVVTKDVEPFSIVAGVPAKFMRKRHSKHKISLIEDALWWNKDLDEARVIIDDLECIGDHP